MDPSRVQLYGLIYDVSPTYEKLRTISQTSENLEKKMVFTKMFEKNVSR